MGFRIKSLRFWGDKNLRIPSERANVKIYICYNGISSSIIHCNII